ncbi:hypothetical protein DL96DRAFT_1608625 [Flagelloscypha sp. PMI_526]|nr:hypothetical protein DL96DRAFT_1608625 [Flagelloscypha sp. PMI_526]
MPSATMLASTSNIHSQPHHQRPQVRKNHSSSSSRSTATSATLKSLYNRAASAFLQRDIALTQSLLDSALSLLKTPQSQTLSSDLDELRRKWDILRVTLVATVCSSSHKQAQQLPEPLHSYVVEPPSVVCNRLWNESLQLHTPLGHSQPNASRYLPAPVLVALAYAALKLDAALVARNMIEDWLGHSEEDHKEEEYEKILEVYVLQVLVRLDEWDYAKEFLEYEIMLTPSARDRLRDALRLHQEQSSQPSPLRQSALLESTSASSTPRAQSPAPSTSSSSSMSTTTSNRTVVPPTPRAPQGLTQNALSTLPSSPMIRPPSANHSDTTTTRRQQGRSIGGQSTESARSYSKDRPWVNGHATSPLLQHSNGHANGSAALSSSRSSSPSTFHSLLTLLKTYLQPYTTPSNLMTIIFVFVIIPVVSVVMRIRRRRSLISGNSSGMSHGRNVDFVKRKLLEKDASGGGPGVFGALVRSVADFVRMGQSGLV